MQRPIARRRHRTHSSITGKHCVFEVFCKAIPFLRNAARMLTHSLFHNRRSLSDIAHSSTTGDRICYFGDAYGWLRLRICYFGDYICYFGDAYGWLRLRICYFGDSICYIGDLICYFGDLICYSLRH